MENRIKYMLIKEDTSRDFKRLKCIIDSRKRVIFEFSYEVLRWKDCLNLGENPSAEALYKKIEKFLKRKLDNETLREKYQINSKNFREFCL